MYHPSSWRRGRNPRPPRYRKHARVCYRGRRAVILKVRLVGPSWVYDISVGLKLLTEVSEDDIDPLTGPGKDSRMRILALSLLALILLTVSGCQSLEVHEVNISFNLNVDVPKPEHGL